MTKPTHTPTDAPFSTPGSRQARPGRLGWLRSQLGVLAFVGIAAVFLGLATWANLDLREARAFLFVDELIIHDGVRRILDAPNGATFWHAVTDGDDHRYGRILYNTCALTGAIPYRTWGVPGLIVATRTTLTLALLAAYVILACRFLDSWGFRAAALALLCLLPFSLYYFTAPKPEPLQILFLALFLARGRRCGWAFGWHWIWLGLAFGAKISALMAVGVIGTLTLATAVLRSQQTGAWRSEGLALARAASAFLSGWVLAVPILGSLNATAYQAYWGWTFAATTHGSDSATTGPGAWVRAFFDTSLLSMNIPPTFVAITTGAMLALLVGHIITLLRDGGRPLGRLLANDALLLTLLSGVLTVPIVMLVKRLWGFYLHGGMVFGVLGAAVCAERLWNRWIGSDRTRSAVLFSGATSAMLSIAWWAVPAVVDQYHKQAHRTQGDYFRWQAAVYYELQELLPTLARLRHASDGSDRPLEVSYDPFLFTPEPRSDMRFSVSWGPFRDWHERFDVIVLSQRDQLRYLTAPVLATELPETKSNYAGFRSAQGSYHAAVEGTPETPAAFTLFREVQGEASVFVHRRFLPLPDPASP